MDENSPEYSLHSLAAASMQDNRSSASDIPEDTDLNLLDQDPNEHDNSNIEGAFFIQDNSDTDMNDATFESADVMDEDNESNSDDQENQPDEDDDNYSESADGDMDDNFEPDEEAAQDLPDADDSTNIQGDEASELSSTAQEVFAADENKVLDQESDNDNDDESASQADSSDSDDDSTSDTGTQDSENESLRQEALKQMKQIESDFVKIRETLYQERMGQINLEELQINQGTHPELSSRLDEIEQKRADRIRKAKALKEYLIQSYNNQFDAIRHYIQCQFYEMRAAARRDLLSDRTHKLFKLKAEKRKLDTVEVKLEQTDRYALHKRKKIRKQDLSQYQIIYREIGFPIPSIKGLSSEEKNYDLEYLRMHKPIKLDVYPDNIDGRRVLKYFGVVFQPNEQVNVTDTSSQAVFQIRLISIGDSEITGQRNDGSKTRISIASLRDNRHTLRSILSSNSNSIHSSHPVSQHHAPPSSIPPEHQRNLNSFEKSKSYPSPSNDGSSHSLLNSSSGPDSNNTSGTVTAASSPVFSKPSLPESVGSAQGSKSSQPSQPLKSQAQVPPIPNSTPTSAQSDGDAPSSNSTTSQVSKPATASTTALPSASSQGPRLTTYVSGTKVTSSSPKIQPSNVSNQSTTIDQTKSKESAPATSSSSSSHSVSNSTASTTATLNPGTTSVPPTKPVSPKPSNVSGNSNVNGSGGSSGTGGSGIQNKSVSVSSTA